MLRAVIESLQFTGNEELEPPPVGGGHTDRCLVQRAPRHVGALIVDLSRVGHGVCQPFSRASGRGMHAAGSLHAPKVQRRTLKGHVPDVGVLSCHKHQ